MLERIGIENFRCFKRVEVDLRRMTVLIGLNDTGKSAFLAAIQNLVNETAPAPSDVWRHAPGLQASYTATTDQGTCRIPTRPAADNLATIHALRPTGFFHLLSQGLSMESNGYGDDQGPPSLGPDGSGVPTLMDYLLRQDRDRFFAAVAAIRTLVPGVEGINIATPDATRRRLDLIVENGMRLPATMASSGVRMLLFFVALAYHPTPPKIILLEEPETGLHPKRLGDVMRLLREITEGKHGGQAAQVIVTTHSPYLLDFVDLDEDQVLVFRREPDGSRTVEPADADRLKTFRNEFLLGEVWFNQGEEGLVARR